MCEEKIRSCFYMSAYLLSYCRKVLDTTVSLIERLLPKRIRAVTARGFELKVALFILAASFNSRQVAT